MNNRNGITPEDIFNVHTNDFVLLAERIFNYQYHFNKVYHQFCKSRHLNAQDHLNFSGKSDVCDFPFLPISFFKTHRVQCGDAEPGKIFTSSGTSGIQASKHFVNDISMYEKSFSRGFREFYGDHANRAVLCLLPSYMEREGSSLIYMCQHLIDRSECADSGFFLHERGQLLEILKRREDAGQQSLLIGVSFALLDFALENPLPLKYTGIMETGGMKGRKREMTRMELHEILKQAFGVATIHSEYGMTELLSQAYSSGSGLFRCPRWMQVLVRDEDDPFKVRKTGAGILCIIDLANVHSCSFIETADVGRVYPDGSFEVLGRVDQSDIRGCSLLVV